MINPKSISKVFIGMCAAMTYNLTHDALKDFHMLGGGWRGAGLSILDLISAGAFVALAYWEFQNMRKNQL